MSNDKEFLDAFLKLKTELDDTVYKLEDVVINGNLEEKIAALKEAEETLLPALERFDTLPEPEADNVKNARDSYKKAMHFYQQACGHYVKLLTEQNREEGKEGAFKMKQAGDLFVKASEYLEGK
ncbi:hypothetical protein [Dehalococcoides mccartyi]|uniref:hypothetical protein n=1 Tax=Dehalococcoides mccartyi TaxID=61435 RepID=UPI00398A7573